MIGEFVKWALESSREAILIVLVLYAAVDTDLSWGLTPALFEGFAPKTELGEAKTILVNMQASNLRMRLFNLRAQVCELLKAHNPVAAKARSEQYDFAWNEYFELTKIQYPLKPCVEF